MTIHPHDDDLWFVTSYVNGLLVTRDGGLSCRLKVDSGSGEI